MQHRRRSQLYKIRIWLTLAVFAARGGHLAILFRWGRQDTPYIRELAFLDNRMSSVYLL